MKSVTPTTQTHMTRTEQKKNNESVARIVHVRSHKKKQLENESLCASEWAKRKLRTGAAATAERRTREGCKWAGTLYNLFITCSIGKMSFQLSKQTISHSHSHTNTNIHATTRTLQARLGAFLY